MLRTLLLLIAITFAGQALANETELQEILQKKLPQLGKIVQVSKSPIPGLYEVVTESQQLLYSDEQGQFLIEGSIYDLKTMRNVTEARARQLFAVDFDKLPLNLAVKKVKGKGERKLAYFTDPNCGFCQRLEKEMQQIDNVTLYLFLYPIFQGSDEKVKAVWCSKDQVKAWDDLMQKGIVPPPGKCATPTDKVMALGRQLHVNGTPALVFANGVINPGYLPAAQLDKALSENDKH